MRSAGWSPDGARLASGGDNGTVRIWDSASGDIYYRAVVGRFVACTAYSGSGALAVGTDQTVLVIKP